MKKVKMSMLVLLVTMMAMSLAGNVSAQDSTKWNRERKAQLDSIQNTKDQAKKDESNLSNLKSERAGTHEKAKVAQEAQHDANSAAREAKMAYRSEKRAQKARRQADKQQKKAERAKAISDHNN